MSGSNAQEFVDKYNPETITGGFIDGHDVVGYCHFVGHRGYLLQKHLKEHDCCNKKSKHSDICGDCRWLERNDNCRYFQRLEFTKKRRRVAQKLEKFWKKGFFTASVYMSLVDKMKKVNNEEDLRRFLAEQVNVTLEVDFLMNIDIQSV